VTAALAVMGTLGAQVPGAGAQEHHSLRLISTGDNSRDAYVPYWSRVRFHGSRVFFGTFAALPGTDDSDSNYDVYERRTDGGVHLTSIGDDNAFSFVVGLSEDGSRVFFQTGPPPMVGWQPDDSFDIYERHIDGTLRLIADGGEDDSTRFAGASVDGERVFFNSSAALVAADTDASADVYERRADGGLRLVSTGGDNGPAYFDDASADGRRVFFSTAEALTSEDAGQGVDVYERRANGELRLISAPASGSVDHFVSVSADGDRALFTTMHAFPGTGDTDRNEDIYERRSDGSVRLVTFETEGVSAWSVGSSSDGSRVFLQSYDQVPGTEDDDIAIDLYERQADGTVRLISGGVLDDASSLFAGASEDGTRVFFETAEALPGTGDTDVGWDVYERHADGTLRLISTSGSDDNARFAWASADGTRAFFETEQPNPELGDTDHSSDIYERRADGELRLISTTRTDGITTFAGVSEDGSRVYFETDEALPLTGDRDSGVDVYEHTWSDTPPPASDDPPPPDDPPPTPDDPPPPDDPPSTPDDPVPTLDDPSSALDDPPFATVDGAGAPEQADLTAPAATLSAPRCSHLLSRGECRRYRHSRRAWRTLSGSASDAGGLATVEVNVVRHVHRRCWVYTGRTFSRRPCQVAGRRFVEATLDGQRWRLTLRHLQSGVHVVRVRAADRAQNVSSPVRRRIKLR
jgi:Tol biopolymer transport system component